MRGLCFILILFSFVQSNAQLSPKPTYIFTTRAHYGFVWGYSPEVEHLARQHMPGIELNVTKQTTGTKAWQQEYRYPQVGYSLIYYAFDRDKPIGNALALFLHAGKKFYKTKRTNLQWRLGYGIAYVEKRFDAEENYKNLLISQRISFTINGQLNFNVRISPRWSLNTGIGLFHISNGSLKRPNFGINLPSIHAGVGFNIVQGDEQFKRDSLASFKRRTYFHISPFAGLKEVYPVNGPKYFLGGINAVIERRVNRKSGLQAGLDFSYDHSKKSEIEFFNKNISNNFIHRSQMGILVGHELYLQRLSLLTQMGVYVYDPTRLNKAMYQKVGVKYYLSDKIFINMVMKLHLGIADWLEWGGGIRL
jgi:hypothetical protein